MSDGDTVVTEINGDWIDVLGRDGRPLSDATPAGLHVSLRHQRGSSRRVPVSRLHEPGRDRDLHPTGRLLWRYQPTGPERARSPLARAAAAQRRRARQRRPQRSRDRYRPAQNRIVWQYGHTARPGAGAGYLANPDGVDLAPPHSLTMRFATRCTRPERPTAKLAPGAGAALTVQRRQLEHRRLRPRAAARRRARCARRRWPAASESGWARTPARRTRPPAGRSRGSPRSGIRRRAAASDT